MNKKQFSFFLILIFIVFFISFINAFDYVRTPNNMVSNNEPAPFSTTCFDDGGNFCWKAYADPTGDPTSNVWGTNLDGGVSVTLDLGDGNTGTFNRINWTNYNGIMTPSSNIKAIEILGSNDGISFTSIYSNNSVTPQYFQDILFTNNDSYRYWKVSITQDYGFIAVYISNLTLFNSNETIISNNFDNVTYANVNVTKDLTVGNDLYSTNGFFNNLGNSISRIFKGWFNDLDVSGTTNLSGQTYLKNTSCSKGEVLTTDSEGLVSCINITQTDSITQTKSGFAKLIEGKCTLIKFNTPFLSVPVVIGSLEDGGKNNIISLNSVSTSSFNLCLRKSGIGKPASHKIYWIATNSGNL